MIDSLAVEASCDGCVCDGGLGFASIWQFELLEKGVCGRRELLHALSSALLVGKKIYRDVNRDIKRWR